MLEAPDHFFTQSGVIPWRRRGDELEILLISSRKRRRWVIPKGVKEPHLSAAASAAREALEEAGVEGAISSRSLGSYRYRKWGGVCTVEVFALRVETILDDWPESSRQRAWLSPAEAARRVDEADLRRLILKLEASLHR